MINLLDKWKRQILLGCPPPPHPLPWPQAVSSLNPIMNTAGTSPALVPHFLMENGRRVKLV